MSDATGGPAASGIKTRLKQFARRLKAEVLALGLAMGDPRTPWLAKALAAVTVAYALSPIDLIPDVVPVLGVLDDALLLPGMIWLTLRLIPADVMAEARARAAGGDARLSGWFGRGGMILIAVLWLATLVAIAWWLWSWSTLGRSPPPHQGGGKKPSPLAGEGASVSERVRGTGTKAGWMARPSVSSAAYCRTSAPRRR